METLSNAILARFTFVEISPLLSLNKYMKYNKGNS